MTLLSYLKLYRLFQPEVIPDHENAPYTPETNANLAVQLTLKGEAQAWFGEDVGIIDHCAIYKDTSINEDVFYAFWNSIEQNLDVAKIFTRATGSLWDKEDTMLLTRLGYIPEAKYIGWYSKVIDLPQA